MIGFITTQSLIDSTNYALDIVIPRPCIEIFGRAMVSGGVFVPMEDEYLQGLGTIPPSPISDFITALGGLSSRIDIDPSDLSPLPSLPNIERP